MLGFPKIGGLFWGVLIMGKIVFWGLSPDVGKPLYM